jgi:hypothetical protein
VLQVKVSIHENQSVFLNNYKGYGFKDKSEMMRWMAGVTARVTPGTTEGSGTGMIAIERT